MFWEMMASRMNPTLMAAPAAFVCVASVPPAWYIVQFAPTCISQLAVAVVRSMTGTLCSIPTVFVIVGMSAPPLLWNCIAAGPPLARAIGVKRMGMALAAFASVTYFVMFVWNAVELIVLSLCPNSMKMT